MLKALNGLLRILIYLIIILVVLLLLFVLSYNIYLQSNLTKVFDDIPGLENAHVEFDKAVINIWDNYPNGEITLNNVRVENKESHKDSAAILTAEKLQVRFKNNAWSSKRLELKSLRINSGKLLIRRDQDGKYNFEELLSAGNPDVQDTTSQKWIVDTDQLEVEIRNTLLSYNDLTNGQSIETYLKKGDISIIENHINTLNVFADIDTKVLDFTLNQENGSFLKDAEIVGRFDVKVDKGGIEIDTTRLMINDEQLSFAANLNSDDNVNSQLYFKNDRTNFEAIKLFLSPNLKETLKPYKIEGLIETEAWLTIMPSHPLRVDIDYVLPGNRLSIDGQIFSDTKMSGHFVNDKYFDKDYKREIRDKGFIRFDIDNAATHAQGADIRLQDALILSGPNHPISINSEAKVSGPTKLISQQLNNDKFLFQNGTFRIDSKLNGRLNNVKNIIERSDLSMVIYDSDVTYLPSNVQLPLKSVNLEKQARDASFLINGLTIDQEYSLELDGRVSNFIGLLYDTKNNRAVTKVDIKAKRLTWQDFIYILRQGSENNITKSDTEKRKSMKQTLRGIQYHFHPDMNITIDSSGYYDLATLEKINARIHFPSKDVIEFSNAKFMLDNGQVNYDCRIDISSDERTPFDINLKAKDVDLSELLPPFDYFGIAELRNLNHLPEDFDIELNLKGIINDSTGIIKESLSGDIIFNSTIERIQYARITFDFVESIDPENNNISYPIETDIQIIGNPVVFNDYFKNDQFFFNNGIFNLNVEYDGENMSLSNVFKNSKIELTIDSSNVLYEPLSVTFPLTNIDLSVVNDTATYNILMSSNSLRQEISLEGEVIHLSEILLENTGQQVKTTSQIYSPKIKWGNFIDIFQIDTSTVFSSKILNDKPSAISNASSKENLIGLLYSFSPDVLMQFDTIEYSDELSLYNFHSDISLLDSVLHISDVNFDYGLGHIDLSAEVDLSPDDIVGFSSHIKADSIDIKPLLEDIELITKKKYPNLKYVSGMLDFDMDLNQKLASNNGQKDVTTALVKFKLTNLEINEAPWMYTIGKKIRHAHRFRNVRFAPIENEVSLSGDSLYIPLMELQSNAFDVFVEGHYHKVNPDIWLSLPLHNLKKRDISIVPEKEGYARRKLKLHLQYAQDKKRDRKLKFRFSKKKFYKKRGL